MQSVAGDDDARAVVWTLFMLHLYEVFNRREDQIYHVLAGTRHNLIAGLSSTRFLTHDAVKNARRACRRSPEEQRAVEELRRKTEQLPVNLEMIADLREHLWVQTSWDFEGIKSKATWLVCCLSFDRGHRASNLTLPGNKHALDHNLRCASTIFNVSSPKGIVKLPAGPELLGVLNSSIVSVRISTVTSKMTGSGRSHKIVDALITRDCEASSQFVDDLAEFVRHSQVSGDDPLFSFYRVSDKTKRRAKKVLTRGEVTIELKKCAGRLNLPSKRFATRSLRKGMSTQMSLGNISREERNRAGGWAPGSTIPDTHYDRSAQLRGALGAASLPGASTITNDQLRSL